MDTSSLEFAKWPTDLLIDYVLKVHHRGIRTEGPQLISLLNKVAQSHPEMTQVAQLFAESVDALDHHCGKEDNVLYPYLYELYEAQQDGRTTGGFHCGSVAFPINVMMGEHDEENKRWDIIRQLTNGYAAPADADQDYVSAIAWLKEFFDLHMTEHIHLENDIIFPWAISAEQSMMGGNF